MNEEEAMKTLKKMKENIDKKYLKTRNSVAIETVLNLLEKKYKIIDEMAVSLQDYSDYFRRMRKDEIKQYFERKVENEN